MSEINSPESANNPFITSRTVLTGVRFERTLRVGAGTRPFRIRRKVRASLQRMGLPVEHQPTSDPQPTTEEEPMRSGLGHLTPVKGLNIQADPLASPPMMKQPVFKASRFRVMGRFLVYIIAVVRWYAGIFKDRILRQDQIERRAQRLRQIIERMGGTAIKLGQQMSLRIDIIPYVYGLELSKMLDKVPPFSADYAIQRIEEQLQAPFTDVFKVFDPDPIGSASVACVFQAILKNGEKVAVKVRRPEIGRTFVADCTALAWIFAFLEMLTLIRPGLSKNFLYEFRTMLLEELDFNREARNTELFGRRVRKNLPKVSTPKVYFDLSGEDVLVTEFVSGVWLGELISAVENKDQKILAELRRQNIDAGEVSKKLLRTSQFSIFENLIFHSDPHPSNVLIQPGNALVFIDFGSCGAYTTKERNDWRQLVYYQSKEDVGRMVLCALGNAEPLPPIDIDEFKKRLENIFWRDLYAFKSKHSEWWEKTSARPWISFLNLAREFNIPMNLNTLRMIRSTLLYETVAARLDKDVDVYKVHRKFTYRKEGKRARKRVNRSIEKRLTGGLTNSDYRRIEEFSRVANRTIYIFKRWLDHPLYHYQLFITKAAYSLTVLYRAIKFFVLSSVFFAGAVIVFRLLFNQGYNINQVNLWKTIIEINKSGWYQLLLLLTLFLNMRRFMFRLMDRQVDRRNTSGLN